MSNLSGKRSRAALAFLPALKDGEEREFSDDSYKLHHVALFAT
jgi:hypothetical protein